MYGGKVSKLIGVGADTYLYFGIFFRNLYGLYYGTEGVDRGIFCDGMFEVLVQIRSGTLVTP